VAKDKKKKKDGKKAIGVPKAKPAKASKAAKRLKSLTENPLVADVVAAALVATAAALKDSKKARQLAAQAGDELNALAKEGAERGNAMWQLALDIGRRSLDSLVKDEESDAGKSAVRPRRKPK
jgi:hypothetical protein